MSAWRFAAVLTASVYASLLPAWVLPMLLACAYVAWYEWSES